MNTVDEARDAVVRRLLEIQAAGDGTGQSYTNAEMAALLAPISSHCWRSLRVRGLGRRRPGMTVLAAAARAFPQDSVLQDLLRSLFVPPSERR